jgi:HD-like signal output (HDOD) protein/CheY-like chemotaxis protein
MANILLLDDNEVAERALKGIVVRGGHRCIAVKTTEQAWRAMRELVKIDLVIAELKLPGENALHFIQRLRNDPLLKQTPVVVYTVVTQHEVVKKALSLKIQNYLIKPYSDEAVQGEIAKALANPWRNLLFEEQKSFCATMGLKPDELQKMRDDLRLSLEEEVPFFEACRETQDVQKTNEHLHILIERGQAAGVWGVVEYLEFLEAKAGAGAWPAFATASDDLKYGAQLIYCQLHPEYVPEGLFTEQELQEKQEEKERAVWTQANLAAGPVLPAHIVQQQLDNLGAFPVVDSVAAAFLMAADGKTPSLNHLMDLVSRDPALSAEVLVAANKIEREGMNPIEDPRTAVSLLGNLRLCSLAKASPTVQERHLRVPPFSWPQFWTFQMGVARLAQFTCTYLEFAGLIGTAYTAGLLHDLGKLLLAKLYPLGFSAMMAHSRQHNVTLQEAERKFIQLSAQDMGAYFAEKYGLPPMYCSVIRWVDTPDKANTDVDLVASVALARHLCLQNHLGFCGDTPKDFSPPLEETTAWQILRGRVFPSFNLKNFESQANHLCATLKQELAGRSQQVA